MRFASLCIAEKDWNSLPARQISYLDAYAFVLYVIAVTAGFGQETGDFSDIAKNLRQMRYLRRFRKRTRLTVVINLKSQALLSLE